ncbi:hypothetical protein [Nitrosomonas communis]|nr:hypothetical protein [Nitrosomonas communis]
MLSQNISMWRDYYASGSRLQHVRHKEVPERLIAHNGARGP